MVALVRNLQTEFISPQFHYVTDQRFETVPGGLQGKTLIELTDETYQHFLKNRWDTDRDYALEDYDPEVDGKIPVSAADTWQHKPVEGLQLPEDDDLPPPAPDPPFSPRLVTFEDAPQVDNPPAPLQDDIPLLNEDYVLPTPRTPPDRGHPVATTEDCVPVVPAPPTVHEGGSRK